ncbi:Putative protein [Zobellia galactanivorans]|uniref:Uncharacterized protein n=1 Tax=Zobellia galactanivorans (strain DSM 12802 / CCUG 47099 / CIP 106680 / NCIMB 13871 / Dsij) TaxID=63186 RepID=G0L0F2_ZOBGA|nr:Putative protein [Zobellia galactanivorans]
MEHKKSGHLWDRQKIGILWFNVGREAPFYTSLYPLPQFEPLFP